MPCDEMNNHPSARPPKRMLRRAAALLAGSLALLPCGCISGCWPAFECGPAHGLVARAIDGDTFDLADGTRVRILGIDAPESQACWGPQSTAAAVFLLEGRFVSLQYADECLDDYGRTLARVVVDGVDAAGWLAGSGAACAWVLQDLPWASTIRSAAREAAGAGRGFWGACPDVPCRSN